MHPIIQYLLSTHYVPGPTVGAVLIGSPTMDTVQTKSYIGQGLDKKHHTAPSNSKMLCSSVL